MIAGKFATENVIVESDDIRLYLCLHQSMTWPLLGAVA